MSKKRIATVWLDGCSGCHMSFLDMDERLLAIAGAADLVYSPLVDAKEFPENVDVTLVEGAVSSEEDLHKIKLVRERTKILVSLGDCAVTANVPGMRNPFGTKAVYDRAYRENVTFDPGIPDQVVPSAFTKLAARSRIRECRRICPGMSAVSRHDLLHRDGIAGRSDARPDFENALWSVS